MKLSVLFVFSVSDRERWLDSCGVVLALSYCLCCLATDLSPLRRGPSGNGPTGSDPFVGCSGWEVHRGTVCVGGEYFALGGPLRRPQVSRAAGLSLWK
jgi:hypothetical protein